MTNNDPSETIETYKQAIRENPNNAEAHFNLGMAYINLERWNEAADAFKSAVKIKNDYDEALRKLGVVYKNLGYLNEAIVVYERALRLKPNNARTYAGLGSVYCKLKCWDKAVEAYKQAIKIEPEYAFAYVCLGTTYHLCGNLDEAVKTLEHAIQLQPNDVEPYIFLGKVYSDQEEWDKAIGIYKQAIRIEPNFADAYSDLGFVYNSLKNWNEAIKAYKQAIDLEPEEYLNYFILGNAYLNYGQLDAAIKNIERAIQLKSNDADLYNTLGNIYGDLEQWDKAIGAYEQAIRITPEDVHVRFSLAFAFSHLKRCDDAIVAFKDIVRIKPDDVNAHDMLGLEYFSLNNLDSAMHEYRILKELDRDKANKLFKLINPDGKESPQKKESDRENFKELLSTGVRLDEEVNFLKEEPEEVIADEETRNGKIRVGGTPELEISNSIFNFHDLRAGSTITDTLTISNAGGGALSGSVKTDKKGIIKHIKESVESLYNHCNKLEHLNNKFSTLLASHEKQEQGRIEKEFNEKEKGLQDAFLLKKEELKNTYNRNTKNENLHYEKIMDETNGNLAQMEKEHRAEWLAWDDTFWKEFAPIKNLKEPPLTRFGELVLKTRDKNNTKTIPALLRLITSKNLILNASGNDKNAAIIALQSIMLRLLVTIPPGKVNFILIDPVGLGSNTAGFMHLPEELVGGKIWTEPNHIEQQLVDLSTHMETIIQKYLRNNFSTMEEYNKEAGEVAEPYRFLVITNFPANFTEAAAQRLVSIASNGPRTGVYVIIMRDTALKLPYNFVIEELERLSTIVECKNGCFVWNDDNLKNHHLVLDRLPSTDLFNHLLKLIGEESKLAGIVQVPFEMALKEIKNWWGLKSDEGLSIPIGRAGARRLQYFSLGKGTLQHVLIGGKTGSGKSNLLHIIILGLCIGYSPDELELYLIDFKKGIEFKSYATMELPHARVIAIQSEREFGLSVLQGLDAELQKRGDLFRHAGVQNLKEFRLKDSVTNMRRIVLLVDEFQEFFTEDDAIASQSALLFDRLVRQGRAFGIHVILASQALAGTYTISSSTTDQMAIRIALQCSEADSRLILGEDNPTARLLSRPGEAVYNDANGLIEGNSLFQILYLSDEDREKYLSKLHNLYHTQRPNAEPHQIVFEGNAPASIERNKILGDLVNAPDWGGDSTQLQAWLGEPIAIKAHTAAVFKRQSRANLMVIGQSEESGAAMLISALIGLAAQRPPDDIEFHILDLSNTDTPWNKAINSLPKHFNHKIAIYTKRHVNDAIEALFSILKEREASESGHKERSIFFFVFGLPRAKELKSSDGYTYPDSTNNLFSLLSNGPDFGIHTICLGDTFKNIEKIIGRNISEFDFRVATQMSINESNELIDSPAANKLGQYRALFYDEEKTGKLEKFRPYALPSSEWLSFVSNTLKNRIK